MKIEELDIPMKWGSMRVQLFGEKLTESKPIIAIHGYLTNSNCYKKLAEYLTLNNEYYVISIDLPGHGFSSHLSTGLYSMKTFIICIRRVVKYFNLDSVTLIGHSYGAKITLAYATIFYDEIDALLHLDLSYDSSEFKKLNIQQIFSFGVDAVMNIDYENQNNIRKRQTMTREFALKKMVESMQDMDEYSANILAERSLKSKDNINYEFTHDQSAKAQIILPDHYSDIIILEPNFFDNANFPVLFIHTVPYFDPEIRRDIVIEQLKKYKGPTKVVGIEGNHYFMINQAEKCANIVKNFLNTHLKKTISKL